MENVAKITPTKINHRKTVSNSSSGDETTERNQTNEKVWLYEENIKKVKNITKTSFHNIISRNGVFRGTYTPL